MMAQAQAKLCSAGLQEPGMPPNFYKFVNPILIMGGRLCLPHYSCPPPLLQTFLRPCSERESSACRLNWGDSTDVSSLVYYIHTTTLFPITELQEKLHKSRCFGLSSVVENTKTPGCHKLAILCFLEATIFLKEISWKGIFLKRIFSKGILLKRIYSKGIFSKESS